MIDRREVLAGAELGLELVRARLADLRAEMAETNEDQGVRLRVRRATVLLAQAQEQVRLARSDMDGRH